MKPFLATSVEAPLMLDARTAADLMVSNPISLRADASVKEAMMLFTEKGITAAPVIDETGRPVGVISGSDLMIHQVEEEKNRAGHPEYFLEPTLGNGKTRGEDKTKKATVVDLMTPAVFAVSPETPVNRVVSDMVGLRVHRMFVVDADGILVGVVSTMDVLKHLTPAR